MITGLCHSFGKGDDDSGVFGKVEEVVHQMAQVRKNAWQDHETRSGMFKTEIYLIGKREKG